MPFFSFIFLRFPDEGVAQNRLEAMERARQKMQAQLDEQAKTFAEKQRQVSTSTSFDIMTTQINTMYIPRIHLVIWKNTIFRELSAGFLLEKLSFLCY